MTMDAEKLPIDQQAMFESYFAYLLGSTQPPPSSETVMSMSYYSENRCLRYRKYLPDPLRKRSTFRDQLVIPSACISKVLHASHDHARLSRHLSYKHTFDKVHEIFWRPTLRHDVKPWCHDCQACQRRKIPHKRPKLPTAINLLIALSNAY